MKTQISRAFYPAILTLLLLGISSCSKKDSAPTEPASASDITIGTTSSIPVSSPSATTVFDPGTGVSFYFPDGGSGMLKVAPITNAPATGCTNVMEFYVEYAGTGDVQVEFPTLNDTTGTLYYYGQIGSACVDETTQPENWWPVTESIDNGVTRQYRLPLPATGILKGSAYTAPTSTYFAYATIAPGSSDAVLLAQYRQTVDQITDLWIQNLPSGIQQTMRTRSNALGYRIDLVRDGNAYQGGNSILFSNSIFSFTRTIELRGIAHEVGHRMTHVLLGFNRFMEIYALFPQTLFGAQLDHEPGKLWTRAAGTLEDYAYISEFLATGYVDNLYDYTGVQRINNFADVTNNASASSVDYPSHEAFSTAMLLSLLRSRDSIYTYDNRTYPSRLRANVPVINAPMADVLGILANGPRTVEEVRSSIENYLASQSPSRQYSMPALYEPLGWSYNGLGKVVDDQNQPVAGAHVQNICQDGSSAYGFRTFLSTPTGTDGGYYLPHMYPGTTILRVFYNGDKDSTDYTVTINWTTPTNSSIQIPDIKIVQTEPWIALLPRMSTASVGIGAKVRDSDGNLTSIPFGYGVTNNISISGFTPLLIQWSGTSFTAHWQYSVTPQTDQTETMTGDISGSVDIVSKTATCTGSYTITTEETNIFPYRESSTEEITTSIKLTAVPFYLFMSPGGYYSISFTVQGTAVPSHIASFTTSRLYVVRNSGGTETYRGTTSYSVSDLVFDAQSTCTVGLTGQ